MKFKLGENIRKMRKERSLTQEALAEALGVTVGAVYKWEADLSIPEVEMLVRIADLFDTSVDAMLGYEAADNRKQSINDRLTMFIFQKDKSGLVEAEKALVKYPNDYAIVLVAAYMYSAFGQEEKNKDLILRAIALFERASNIVPLEVDPKYGRTSIFGNIAQLYFAIDERDKALEMLKKYNEAGVFDSQIGLISALKGSKDDECLSQLAMNFWDINNQLINTILGLIFYYKNRGEIERIKELTQWGIEYIKGIQKTEEPGFLDYVSIAYLTLECFAYFKDGDEKKARELFLNAKEMAEKFDSSPNFHLNICKLFDFSTNINSYNTLGRTAAEAVDTIIKMLDDKKFSAMCTELSK